MDRIKYEYETDILPKHGGCSVPVRRIIHWSRNGNTNNNSKRAINTKYHNYYKYLLAVILGFQSPALANTDVGGVSATANPVANSSGSVTNQAIQVLQGPYITNSYGDGISCQGPTLNVTPFITGAGSFQKPYEPWYMDNVYDMRDLDDDGAPDNPGSILYQMPTRTGQKDNYNLSVGVSATWSKPLNKKQQRLCEEAATVHNQYRAQLLANKRLDFEIARLKNCGELLKQGIQFHPKSPYYSVCADVVVNNVTHVKPHRHSIPSPSVSESRVSESAADLGGPLQTR